jgi:hypothetical protein
MLEGVIPATYVSPTRLRNLSPYTRFLPLQQSIDKSLWVALAYGVFAAVSNMVMPIQSYTEWTSQWMVLGIIYQLGRWNVTRWPFGMKPVRLKLDREHRFPAGQYGG